MKQGIKGKKQEKKSAKREMGCTRGKGDKYKLDGCQILEGMRKGIQGENEVSRLV